VKVILLLFGFVFYVSGIQAQSDTLKLQRDTLKQKSDTTSGKFYLLQKVERDGEKMPEVEIKEVRILAKPRPEKKSEYRKYERLVSNIKRVYPYAVMVRYRLNQVNSDLRNITNEKDRKEYLKKVEKSVFADYEDDIQQMTIIQGRLLIKLIDRETQNTSYDLIREYRGKLSAAFWQGIARIFGTNLKEEYDGFGDDVLIELIINDIEAGIL
jgi:hypothetical protein